MALSAGADFPLDSGGGWVHFPRNRRAHPRRNRFCTGARQMSAAKTEDFYVRLGQEVEVSKAVGEFDICLSAGIPGGLSSNHVNEHVMEQSKFKHWGDGALLIGFMSAGSTRMIETLGGSALGRATAVRSDTTGSVRCSGVHRRHRDGALPDQPD